MFPTIKTSSIIDIISSYNSLPMYIDSMKTFKLPYNLPYQLCSSKCYIHTYNELTRKHVINIKYGSATLYFIDNHVLLNKCNLLCGASYKLECYVNQNVFSNKNDIYNTDVIYYDNIYNVPNDIWLSTEYCNGEIIFIVISYIEQNKRFIFKMLNRCDHHP